MGYLLHSMTLGPFATFLSLIVYCQHLLKYCYWYYSCLCCMLVWLKINVLFCACYTHLILFLVFRVSGAHLRGFAPDSHIKFTAGVSRSQQVGELMCSKFEPFTFRPRSRRLTLCAIWSVEHVPVSLTNFSLFTNLKHVTG